MRVRKHEKNISHDPLRGLQCEILAIKKQLLACPRYRPEIRAQLARLHQRLAHHYLSEGTISEGRSAFRETVRYRFALRPFIYYLSSFAPPLWDFLSGVKKRRPDARAPLSERVKRRLQRLLKRCYTHIDYFHVELDLLSWSPRFTRGSRFHVEQITPHNMERLQKAYFKGGETMLADCLMPGYTGFAVLAGERVVGYFRLGVGSLYVRELGLKVDLKQREVSVHGLYLLPEYRGSGAVGVLFDVGLFFFKERGYQKVLGQIEEENRPSLAFSKHFGFKPVRLMRSRQILSRLFIHREKEIAGR
jgi:ribosomal protein S18 acetylase RimI-like enzyme